MSDVEDWRTRLDSIINEVDYDSVFETGEVASDARNQNHQFSGQDADVPATPNFDAWVELRSKEKLGTQSNNEKYEHTAFPGIGFFEHQLQTETKLDEIIHSIGDQVAHLSNKLKSNCEMVNSHRDEVERIQRLLDIAQKRVSQVADQIDHQAVQVQGIKLMVQDHVTQSDMESQMEKKLSSLENNFQSQLKQCISVAQTSMTAVEQMRSEKGNDSSSSASHPIQTDSTVHVHRPSDLVRQVRDKVERELGMQWSQVSERLALIERDMAWKICEQTKTVENRVAECQTMVLNYTTRQRSDSKVGLDLGDTVHRLENKLDSLQTRLAAEEQVSISLEKSLAELYRTVRKRLSTSNTRMDVNTAVACALNAFENKFCANGTFLLKNNLDNMRNSDQASTKENVSLEGTNSVTQVRSEDCTGTEVLKNILNRLEQLEEKSDCTTLHEKQDELSSKSEIGLQTRLEQLESRLKTKETRLEDVEKDLLLKQQRLEELEKDLNSKASRMTSMEESLNLKQDTESFRVEMAKALDSDRKDRAELQKLVSQLKTSQPSQQRDSSVESKRATPPTPPRDMVRVRQDIQRLEKQLDALQKDSALGGREEIEKQMKLLEIELKDLQGKVSTLTINFVKHSERVDITLQEIEGEVDGRGSSELMKAIEERLGGEVEETNRSISDLTSKYEAIKEDTLLKLGKEDFQLFKADVERDTKKAAEERRRIRLHIEEVDDSICDLNRANAIREKAAREGIEASKRVNQARQSFTSNSSGQAPHAITSPTKSARRSSEPSISTRKQQEQSEREKQRQEELAKVRKRLEEFEKKWKQGQVQQQRNIGKPAPPSDPPPVIEKRHKPPPPTKSPGQPNTQQTNTRGLPSTSPNIDSELEDTAKPNEEVEEPVGQVLDDAEDATEEVVEVQDEKLDVANESTGESVERSNNSGAGEQSVSGEESVSGDAAVSQKGTSMEEGMLSSNDEKPNLFDEEFSCSGDEDLGENESDSFHESGSESESGESYQEDDSSCSTSPERSQNLSPVLHDLNESVHSSGSDTDDEVEESVNQEEKSQDTEVVISTVLETEITPKAKVILPARKKLNATVSCKFCRRILPGRQTAAMHEKVCDQKPSTCKHCNKQFPTRDIRRHETSCSKKTSMEVCRYCDEQFSTQVLAVHEAKCDWMPSKCKYCGMVIILRDIPKHENGCQQKNKMEQTANVQAENSTSGIEYSDDGAKPSSVTKNIRIPNVGTVSAIARAPPQSKEQQSNSKGSQVDVHKWGVDDVCDWLRNEVRIPKFVINIFRDMDVDGPSVLEVTEADLIRQFDIQDSRLRKKLAAAIHTLRDDEKRKKV